MSEALFRGRLVENGNLVYGSLLKDRKGNCYIGTLVENPNCEDELKTGLLIGFAQVTPESVSQDTGVVDKNNKQIWGYCECLVTSTCSVARGYIKLIQGCFVFVEYHTKNILKLCDLALNNYEIEVVNDFYDAKVVGNIYDNPDLLESEEKI